MEFKLFIFALALGSSGVLCEENKRPTNPIINLFEAPLKALRTKPGEAVAVFQPQVVKSKNATATGWYPGQAIGNAANSLTSWISQNTPLGGVLTTTTPEPDVIVQIQSTQGNKKNNKKKKQPSLPDLNQLLQDDDDEEDDDDDEDEQSDDDEHEEEDEKQFGPSNRPNAVGSIYRHGFRNGVRNEARYGPNMPHGSRYRIGIRNGQFYNGMQPQFGPPNQFFDPLDQFYGPPRPQMYYGPLNYRPPVKRRRTGYNKRRPQHAMVYAKPKRKPVQVVLSPEMGGQLPILIPVQTVSLNSRPQKKKKIRRPIITQNDEPDLGFTYVPIPLAQLNLASIGAPSMDSIPNLQSIPNMQSIPNLQSIQGFQGIPAIQSIGVDSIPIQQLQILAQHTHTISQEPQIILSEEIANRPNRPSRPARPARPTKSSRPSRPNMPTRSPRPSQSDPWGETSTQHKFDPNRRKPVIVRISADQSSFNRPDVEQDEEDSYSGGGYDNMPNPFISVGDVEDDDEDESENKNEMQGRSEATSQYYIPQKYFPLLGSDSYLAVSNNGRFLLKTGRDLKVEQNDIVKEESAKTTSTNENVAEINDENGNINKEDEKKTLAVAAEEEIISEKLEKADETEIVETEQTDMKDTSPETKVEERNSETIEVVPVVVSTVPSDGSIPEDTVSTLSLRTANLDAKPQVLLKEEQVDTKDVQSDIKSILESPSEAISSNPKIPAARSHLVPRGGLKYQEYELS